MIGRPDPSTANSTVRGAIGRSNNNNNNPGEYSKVYLFCKARFSRFIEIFDHFWNGYRKIPIHRFIENSVQGEALWLCPKKKKGISPDD